MKRLFIALALVLMLSTSAFGAKLVWDDPNPASAGVYEYQAEFVDSNGQMVANPIVPLGEWVTIIVPDGDYSVSVRAYNLWGPSVPSASISFTKKNPDAPINLRIE
jgi:hypothetical protein